MIVASCGIFIGATFSSGMMEIARKGIFNPEYFYFSEIMIIFLAVMVTDILLLDLFNTFGLPTSTTVSIVFELLGAATAVAFYKVYHAGDSIKEIGNYLNWSSAILIISGIFLSIAVAFLVGVIVQFISRLLFSFHYEKRIPLVGGIWSGIALSGLTYFLLFKGIKGASFVSDDFVYWIKENTLLLLIGSAIFWTIVMQILASVFKINILKIVVLFGTFSLAMAFAGNDLVNFIGVPIAGLESYQIWSNSGSAAEEYTMDILKSPVRTDSMLLVIGGVIMILTLWFSRKAQSVTETEVNLGRDGSTYERFAPNFLSRSLVRGSLQTFNFVEKLLPKSWIQGMEENYLEKKKKVKWDSPAFDMVRASVNLTMAGILIAFATSLKLPLSTTYVSFMVAMGTSLADRAWGRNSAVYRISGVLSVIGGWFMTAIIAFLVAGTMAIVMMTYSIKIIFLILPLIVLVLYMTSRYHTKKQKEQKIREERIFLTDSSVPTMLQNQVIKILEVTGSINRKAIQGLINEDHDALKFTKDHYKEAVGQLSIWNNQLYEAIKGAPNIQKAQLKSLIKCFDMQTDMMQSVYWIVKQCTNHVKNSHTPPPESAIQKIQSVLKHFEHFQNEIIAQIKKGSMDFSSNKIRKKAIVQQINLVIDNHISAIQNGQVDDLIGKLLLGLLIEIKDLTDISSGLVNLISEKKYELQH